MNTTTLSALADFPRQLAAHYAAIPGEFRHWSPPSWDGIPSERFTAIEQICHVRDIEIEGYHVRFQRTLDECNPLLMGIDSEALASTHSYATANAAEAFAAFRTARIHTVGLLSTLSAEQLARTATFEDTAPRHCAALCITCAAMTSSISRACNGCSERSPREAPTGSHSCRLHRQPAADDARWHRANARARCPVLPTFRIRGTAGPSVRPRSLSRDGQAVDDPGCGCSDGAARGARPDGARAGVVLLD